MDKKYADMDSVDGTDHNKWNKPFNNNQQYIERMGMENILPPVSTKICDCMDPCCKTCQKPVDNRCCELRVNVTTYCPCKISWKPCSLLAEFLGTAILVFLGVMSILVDGSELWIIAASFGFILYSLVSIFGPISGGHFNPVVTIVSWLNGDINLIAGLLYILVQHVGAIVGALFVWIFFDAGTGLGTPDAVFPFSRELAFAAEVIGTAILTLVIFFGVKYSTNVALTVGLGFVVLELIFVPISGGAFNWVRFFGPAVISGLWGPWYVYLFAPLVGGLLGFVIYKLCCLLKCMRNF
jgi:glycerol uptake facilitator-like aquaporin